MPAGVRMRGGDPKVAVRGLKGVMRTKVKAAPRSPEKAFPFTL
jgi:hypothetical protein